MTQCQDDSRCLSTPKSVATLGKLWGVKWHTAERWLVDCLVPIGAAVACGRRRKKFMVDVAYLPSDGSHGFCRPKSIDAWARIYSMSWGTVADFIRNDLQPAGLGVQVGTKWMIRRDRYPGLRVLAAAE